MSGGACGCHPPEPPPLGGIQHSCLPVPLAQAGGVLEHSCLLSCRALGGLRVSQWGQLSGGERHHLPVPTWVFWSPL